MRIHLLITLTACFCLAACAEHSGDLLVRSDTPDTPVNQPDNGGTPPPPRNEAPSVPANNGNEPGGGTTVTTGGGSGGSTTGGGGTNTGGGGGANAGNENPNSGTEGSQPVPEPSTLLLVGTGLAAAGLLRRRQTKPKADA